MKGKIMTKDIQSKSIEQLMAEADRLIQQINSDTVQVKGMKEEHRLEFEKHAQNFKAIKSKVQEGTEKTKMSEITSSADGMHEAIIDIVKAFQDLKNKIF
jgi:hypothetical protein